MSKPTQPIVEITKRSHFSAAHRLHSLNLSAAENEALFMQCNNANGHGHNYKVAVTCRGPIDANTGMVINLYELKLAMQTVILELDHKHLDLDVAYFKQGVVSSGENICVYIYDRLKCELSKASSLLLYSVELAETDSNIFKYYGQTNNEKENQCRLLVKNAIIKIILHTKNMIDHHDPPVYQYEMQFPFERDFDVGGITQWMQLYWWLSIIYAILYVLLIFWLQRIMQTRSRFHLTSVLTVWNICLAAFSTIGAVRMAPEFWTSLSQKGVVYSFCNNSYAQGLTSFWAMLFMLSKVIELGDTIFVVLRKQPLIFLHWYHHITVMVVYTWYSFSEHTASGRWFICMNYTVHAFMYSYYAFRSGGCSLPKWIPWCITILQLTQMLIGCCISLASFYVKHHSIECHQSDANIKWSLVMYATYFALFFQFFRQSYYTSSGKYNDCANGGKKLKNGNSLNFKDEKNHSANLVHNGHSSSGFAKHKNGNTCNDSAQRKVNKLGQERDELVRKRY